MTPQEAAQEGWNLFERLIRKMNREDYATACEELSCTCDSSAEAVRGEIAEDDTDGQ